MTIAKKNFGCSAKPAARRGPKPVKLPFLRPLKKRKNRFKIGWNHKKEELGCFASQILFLAPGGTLEGVLPP